MLAYMLIKNWVRHNVFRHKPKLVLDRGHITKLTKIILSLSFTMQHIRIISTQTVRNDYNREMFIQMNRHYNDWNGSTK